MTYLFNLNYSNLARLGQGFILTSLIWSYAWGQVQPTPDFGLPKSPKNGQTFDTQADKLLLKYRLPLTPTKRKELLRDLHDSSINLNDYLYLAKLLEIPIENDEKKQILNRLIAQKDTNNLERFREFLTQTNQPYLAYSLIDEQKTKFHPVFDFNTDGKADMLIFPEGYFGPSMGYKIYAREGDKFKYVFDNSGNFVEVKAGKNKTRLRFSVTQIEPSETQISQTIIFDHLQNQCTAQPKLYYATQTKIPPQLANPLAVSLLQTTELRFSPTIDNTPRDTTNIYDTLTTVLRGNVVAEYRAGVRAYLLAKEGDWAFVAFAPDTPPAQSSLKHGLDSGYYDEKGNFIPQNRIKPYLAGWVKKNFLK
ncbi:MAG: caleosin family protein [Microscillaceae bacterium]|jgi:hypothetical protein|nr:caleosin family protein [Microscillaceae bacterium]